ncbi:MAG: FAD-dependent oxidoreductase [Chloroflexota bacterium]|nr:FAD-dependent oxidoreductase [Chloroflexota bacterium]
MRTKYLIIGNSAGGIGAAEAIREVDKQGTMVIISDEPYLAYSRPLIAKYLAEEYSLEEMLFRPADFYTQNNITSLLGRRVEYLKLESRIAELSNNENISWEKVLLASGGVPIVPRVKGITKRGVFTFTTIDDAKAIGEFLGNAQKAVVIGGGLIGISATEALIKRGIEVTIVEMKERILNTILDKQASLMAERVLRQAGVEIITDHTVTEICGREIVEGSVLDNNEVISCDLVIVAIGVSLRTELAVDAGIRVNRGVITDRHMSTSNPDVYSCGDAAEAYDFVYGSNSLAPVWPNAYIGGRIAGYNMAGNEAEYPGGTAMNSLNYFGLDITAAGMATLPSGNGYEVITKQKGDVYQKVVLQNNIVVGMIFVKDIEKSGIIFGLMRDSIDVRDFKQSLLADDFGLASLPQTLRQGWLEIPPGAILQEPLPVQGEETFAGE